MKTFREIITKLQDELHPLLLTNINPQVEAFQIQTDQAGQDDCAVGLSS